MPEEPRPTNYDLMQQAMAELKTKLTPLQQESVTLVTVSVLTSGITRTATAAASLSVSGSVEHKDEVP